MWIQKCNRINFEIEINQERGLNRSVDSGQPNTLENSHQMLEPVSTAEVATHVHLSTEFGQLKSWLRINCHTDLSSSPTGTEVRKTFTFCCSEVAVPVSSGTASSNYDILPASSRKITLVWIQISELGGRRKKSIESLRRIIALQS